jgi:sugar (pentulose or hexulose) kinase
MKTAVLDDKTALGIEFGTTRIKAILINETHIPIASGSHVWENRFEHGIWTYTLEDIWTGLQDSFHNLCIDVIKKYRAPLKKVGAIGISAMMHGYMPFDKKDNLLVPFRTWRNLTTEKASSYLTELFNFNIPQRWCIAHLYQAILNEEHHIGEINFLTTLEGYVHWKLTGQKVLGIGEASGVLPVDNKTRDYDSVMIDKFNLKIREKNLPWMLPDILPKIVQVGENAGNLSEEGARLLDPTGFLQSGIPFCPPEGDAITGMIATNSVSERSGNVSAGTSVFLMTVLERPLSKPYPEVDMFTLPNGKPAAMIHSSNCTSDLNAWVNIFREFSNLLGVDIDQTELFKILYEQALKGDKSGGGLLAYNSVSGEHLLHLEEGRPLFVRTSGSSFTLANFMRTHLLSALAALKIGLRIYEKECVEIDHIFGHGGFFKTKEVGQKIMAAALNAPVSTMETAGEGGAWGMALLAAYMQFKADDETFDTYLAEKVFAGQEFITIAPDQLDVSGFTEFMEIYEAGLAVERMAVEVLK